MKLTALFLVLITIPSSADADSSGVPVLLEFSSPTCGPCRQMKPVIAQLVRHGYPIKAMEIDDDPDLAARYQVERVPTFVVVDPADGRQIDRSEGARSAQALAEFYNNAVAKAELAIPPVRKVRRERSQGQDESRESPKAEARDDERPATNPNPKPWETVVRIKVHGQGAIGFGSGTIISSTPSESIILTCAHIFKMERGSQYPPSRFPRKITIDLFDGRLSETQPPQVHYSNESYEGRAIDYDFVRDVGLIRITPGRRLPYARVVPTNWTPEAGKAMITVGCSESRDATAWSTKISNPTMRGRSGGGAYDAIECLVAPKQGRSGGGLFTYDGYVAGVCDFAEPMGNHGLYAAPSSIYALLDRNKLMALYDPPKSRSGALLAKNSTPPPARRNAPAVTRAQIARSGRVRRSDSPAAGVPGNQAARSLGPRTASPPQPGAVPGIRPRPARPT